MSPRRIASASAVFAMAALLLLPALAAAQGGGGAAGTPAAPAPLAAQGCIGCHGPNGTGSGGTPAITGRDRAEFAATMAAFRANERQGTIMNRIARGYTDAEIAAMANHFAAIR
ncbi:MAG TPA: c-type cytochrome [Acetobacteraceae bacterium]|nr:c-type cytochrome [Acetobacteraceae bacterium]